MPAGHRVPRPVDYGQRVRHLGELEAIARSGAPAIAVDALLQDASDGRAKLWVTWRRLQLRGEQPDLFRHGSYRPLASHGRFAGSA